MILIIIGIELPMEVHPIDRATSSFFQSRLLGGAVLLDLHG